MKRKLYIHIGAHRTATTSIQRFMHANFPALITKGYLYPYRIPRHMALINNIFNGIRTVEDVAKDFNTRADSKDHDIHSLVISDEDIAFRKSLKRLAKFKEHFDVKIVMFLRRQDLWLESWYFQNVKWQWDKRYCHLTFPEFMAQRKDFHWVHYDRYLADVAKHFGKENVLLSVFERDQMPGGPIAEFCRQIGLSDLEGMTEPPSTNASYDPEFVEFIRHLPLDDVPTQERHVLRMVLEAVHDKHITKGKKSIQRVLGYEERVELMQHYDAGNAKIAQAYFDREQLFLDPMPAPDAPISELKMPSDPSDVLERYVAPLILELYEQGLLKR